MFLSKYKKANTIKAFSKHAGSIAEVCKFVENFCESSENKNEIRYSLNSLLKISSAVVENLNEEVKTNEVFGQNWIDILDKLFEDSIVGLDLITLIGLVNENFTRFLLLSI